MKPQSPILKEIRPHGTKAFPCAIYRTHSVGKGVLVKHHWHEEAEILYFSGGKFRLEINMESFPAYSECIYFINPGELHSIITESSESHWEDAIVFSPDILSFDSYDEAQIHLLNPICSGSLLFPRCLTPEHPAFASIRNAFLEMLHSLTEDNPIKSDASADVSADLSADVPADVPTDLSADVPADVPTDLSADVPADVPTDLSADVPADICADTTFIANDLISQLYIKSSLLYIFATLSRHRLFVPTEKNLDKRVESVKTALTYIKDNYQSKICIADLAGQVNLNEQYFCRLFKKAIGRSPMEYTNEYRIKQARRLLEETSLPVTDICLECGYNNLGNFLREFRKYTQNTPLQYRKSFERADMSRTNLQ